LKIISIVLIIVGVLGLLLSMFMYGDIAIASMIGSLSALLSGVGFSVISKKIQ